MNFFITYYHNTSWKTKLCAVILPSLCHKFFKKEGQIKNSIQKLNAVILW